MKRLKSKLFFVHGPSGAGKDPAQKKLIEEFREKGYKVHTIASGDLFRALASDPKIAARMKKGEYFRSLKAIMPKFGELYAKFLDDYEEHDGKAILIMDGFIRRDKIVRKGEPTIPSQIDQIAKAIHKEHLKRKDGKLNSPEEAADMIREANHILIDIDPRDAERHMRMRANKELDEVSNKLGDFNNRMPLEKRLLLNVVVQELKGFANDIQEDSVASKSVEKRVRKLRNELVKFCGLKKGSSYAKIFARFGIKTSLRDDDISYSARKKRAENFFNVEGGKVRPAFAAKALRDGLGFIFNPDGTMSGNEENLMVVPNGRERGVDLLQFNDQCAVLAEQLYQRVGLVLEGGRRAEKLGGRDRERR